MKHHLALVRKDSKYWIAFLLIGILFIVTGCYSLWYPLAQNASVARIIGLLAIATGVIKVIFSAKKRHTATPWKTHVAIGIFNVLIGVFLMSYQAISMFILPFMLSFWILAGGVAVIEEETDLHIFHTTSTDWMIIGAILSVVAFIITGYIPFLGLLTAMLAAAIFLIIVGLFYVLLSLRLRFINKEFRDTEMNITH